MSEKPTAEQVAEARKQAQIDVELWPDHAMAARLRVLLAATEPPTERELRDESEAYARTYFAGLGEQSPQIQASLARCYRAGAQRKGRR